LEPTRRRSDVIGLPAVGEDGRPAGRIADLIFSSRGDRVIGLLLQGGTWRRRRLIPYEEIGSIGPAAVMLRAPVVLAARDGARLARLRRPHRQVLGQRVLAPDGRDLGIVEDVCFRSADGQVAGYLVTRGLVHDLAEGKGFLPVERLRRQRGDGVLLTTPP
jgi:uncharacterized protein YrrD